MTSRPRSSSGVGQARRTRPVRRASAGLTPVRAGALLAMLASAGAIYGAGASGAFAVSTVELSGLHYTDEAAVRSRLDVAPGANVFTLSTEPLEARLAELPTIERTSVDVRLPGTIVVDVVEREAIVIWRVGEERFLVDRDGWLFAELSGRAATADAPVPTVEDRRAASAGYGVGTTLQPVDLDAATRLGSLAPTDVGSAGGALRVQVDDANGFIVRGTPGWAAIFGFYTPSLRTPEMIPGQVRTLRSLLLRQGERNVARVILASETDGTFTTPAPSASPAG